MSYPDAMAMVHHTHMPHTETARMKGLRKDRLLLLDKVATIDSVRIPRHRGHRSRLMAGSVPSDRGQQSTRSRAAFQTMAGTIPF